MSALNAFITLLIVVDPILVLPVFVELTRDLDHLARRHIALKGVAISAAVLFAFALLGDQILHALSISLPAFRIAGGALLFLLAIDMVFAKRSGIRIPTMEEEAEAGRREDISVFPLAFPLIAGPGAITTVLLLATGSRGNWPIFLVVLLVVAIVMAITLTTLLAAPRIVRLLGETGANVIGRVLGLLLSALAVQFVVDGIRESFR